jgi:hypothetical protein
MIAGLDRAAPGAPVARRFSPAVMADGYERAYRRLLASDAAAA